uniref:Uncharacterized protein n=1 Tax=Oryza rufipogon TaxID=4529 RepID=A0A0E0NF08_ORYRU
MFSCLHPRRPGAGRPLPNSTPPDNLHPCRPPLHRVQLLRYLHARGEMTPTAENSMPPSLKPRRQASTSAPRPLAAAATVCCGWYPSITVRSSRSAITVVPWCAHGQHTNCLMKCMIEDSNWGGQWDSGGGAGSSWRRDGNGGGRSGIEDSGGLCWARVVGRQRGGGSSGWRAVAEAAWGAEDSSRWRQARAGYGGSSGWARWWREVAKAARGGQMAAGWRRG